MFSNFSFVQMIIFFLYSTVTLTILFFKKIDFPLILIRQSKEF